MSSLTVEKKIRIASTLAAAASMAQQSAATGPGPDFFWDSVEHLFTEALIAMWAEECVAPAMTVNGEE
jgi:hypothetical protein